MIKNLKLSGPYQVAVNSNGLVELPTHQSYGEYIGIAVNRGFNMTIQLLHGANAEFTTVEGNHTYRISGSDDNRTTKKIEFDRMETDNPQIKSISLLMKSPQIAVNGNASFKLLYRDISDFISTHRIKGLPANLDGKFFAKVDHVDHYDNSGKRSYTKNPLTYLNWLVIDKNQNGNQYQLDISLPGSVYNNGKQVANGVSWQNLALSKISILAIISMLVATVIITRLLWARRRKIDAVTKDNL